MGGLGVKFQHFPLTLLVVLTTLTLPCERDVGNRMVKILPVSIRYSTSIDSAIKRKNSRSYTAHSLMPIGALYVISLQRLSIHFKDKTINHALNNVSRL